MNRFDKSRAIVERIVVEGDLVLLTPTSLGNGDSDGLTDLLLLLDEVDGSALLTGTSIAGAMRNYLREREHGFEEKETDNSIVRKLFGYHEENYAQSLLIIDDALSNDPPTTELRDSVRIKGTTRTAYDDEKGKGSKFDIELLEAGTTFKLRFELLISEAKDKNGNLAFPPRSELLKAFATALQGFENGEIHLGARKRRGYGECKVENWKVKKYNLIDKTDLIDWLKNGGKNLSGITPQPILTALGATLKDEDDKREYFEMNACFALDGSMLIRSGSKLSNINEKGQPDTVHLRSEKILKDKQGKLVRDDQGMLKKENSPTISGTSLAGVLRHRAVKICNTLKDGSGESFVEQIFGVDMNKEPKPKEPFASRLEVKETFIENTNDLVQTRVKIDRFTGGAFEGALFDAAPVFAKDGEKAIEISLKLRSVRLTKDGQPETDEEKVQRTNAEIGLLLLLLKDLWTRDLAIGGESSIGRGRLKGKSACLSYKNGAGSWHANLTQETDGKIKIDNDKDAKFFNDFVDALNRKIKI